MHIANTPVANWAITEAQWYLALHHAQSMGDVAGNVYIWSFKQLYRLTRSESLSCILGNESSCDCPGGCHGNIAYVLPNKGYQLTVYRCLWLFAALITQDASPIIVVAWLMIIVKIGYGACSYFMCLAGQPIQWLYTSATNSLCNYFNDMTKHHWRPRGAHSQDQAGSVLLSHWSIQTASTVLKNNNDQVTP